MNPTIRGNRDFKTKYIFDGPISSGGGVGEWENEKDDDSKAAHTAHVRSLSSHTSNTWISTKKKEHHFKCQCLYLTLHGLLLNVTKFIRNEGPKYLYVQ